MSAAEQPIEHPWVSGRLLARNTVWNLLGQLLPMVVGVLAIPFLVRGLGLDRFGLLSLAWILIGYFSLFDLGLGRALTKLVADQLGSRQESLIPALAWTALLFLALLGIIGGIVAWAISGWLITRELKIPASLQREALQSFYCLAAAIPLVTVTSGLRGILEALQRFRVLNLIRIPTSVFLFAGPLLVLPFSRHLVPVIVTLIIGRLVSGLAHLLACVHSFPLLRRDCRFDVSLAAPLGKLGGWMTVSNIVGPLMMYTDRFVVGAIVSVAAVSYYSAPFDAVNRLSVIPGSVVAVLFPAFAVTFVQAADRAELLLTRGVKYIFMAVFPIVLVIIALAPEILSLWLGPSFANESTPVLRWLAAGIFVNSLAQVPFVLIQSMGRPDITAKLHLLQLPVYLAGLWVLTVAMGIRGAAIAWSGRVLLDAGLLFLCSHRLLPHRKRFVFRLIAVVGTALAVFYSIATVNNFAARFGLLLICAIAFALISWFWLLAEGERRFIVHRQIGSTAAPQGSKSG